jgi:hypothetical protein
MTPIGMADDPRADRQRKLSTLGVRNGGGLPDHVPGGWPRSEPAHHHHSTCGSSQCDAAIAIAISVPTLNVFLNAVLGGSD